MNRALLRSALMTAGSLALALSPPAALPTAAQPFVAQQAEAPFNRVRALNLARNVAVQLNGGLSLYRPAPCMFATSDANNPCLVRRDAQGFLFRFLGGPPGWHVEQAPPSRETEVLIAPDGRSVLQVIYNGVPR